MKTFKSLATGNLFTAILVLVMISGVTLFSSCTATLRTPRHSNSTIVIQSQDHSRRQIRIERRNEKRAARERDRHHE